MAVCIAVIAKENYPLFIKTATNAPSGSSTTSNPSVTEQNLKFWYTIHTSLDVVEEKTRKTDFKDLYLGLLYLIEDYRIYGYITNTKIKFIIITESTNQQFHDTEIKIMFKKLHTSYINTLCNPFYNIGEQIKSKKFEELVKSLLLKTTTAITPTPLASQPPASAVPAVIATAPTTMTTSASSPVISQAQQTNNQHLQNQTKLAEFTI